ncbi:MAG: SCO family protein [Rhabdaerophilum sp.]
MLFLRRVRLIGWALVAVLGFLSTSIFLGWWQVDGPGSRGAQSGTLQEIPGVPQIGGAFSLINHRGERVTDRDFMGKPKLVFFGFTHCPDVCPTTLLEITNRLEKLGAAANRIQVLFISADPERDSPGQMAEYISSFDPRIVGLTGSQAEIDAVAKAYRAIVRRVPNTEGGYTVDHTASVFMMDSNDRLVGLIDFHEQEEMALSKMRRLAPL